MLRSLINECRAELIENDETPAPANDDPKSSYKTVRLSKADRAANKVGYLLNTEIGSISRKKMRKMLPYLSYHFTKGYGKGEDDTGVVDAHDLAKLGSHAEKISAHAHGMKRMCGPAHNLASGLCRHVADAHERMGKHNRDLEDEKSGSEHDGNHEKFRMLSRQHRIIARRHGYYEGDY